MYICPVCGKENTTLQCACGFDMSRDYEGYPTLAPLKAGMPSRAAFGENLKDLFRCGSCGGFSFLVNTKIHVYTCVSCGIEWVLTEDDCPTANMEKSFCKPAIALGDSHTIGLRSDGTVIATGDNSNGQCNVKEWTNVISISASGDLTAAVRSDGTVLTCGRPQCDTSKWTDIAAISVGKGSILGLRKDGTVVHTSAYLSRNKHNLSGWRNITGVTSRDYSSSFGIQKDGSVVAVTPNNTEQRQISNWKNITALAVTSRSIYGLTKNGNVRSASPYTNIDISQWQDIQAIAVQRISLYGLKKDGTVVTTNKDLRPIVSKWQNVVAIDAGTSHVAALLFDGTVVAAGDNLHGECNVSHWNLL